VSGIPAAETIVFPLERVGSGAGDEVSPSCFGRPMCTKPEQKPTGCFVKGR
jgi:hypothetical protein